MTYYADLTQYEYYARASNPATLNIGWLDASHIYAMGSVSDTCLERLWAYCREPVIQSKGFHLCELCREPEWPCLAQRGDEGLKLGSAEIRVPSKGGKVYAAPDFIYHYMVKHNYKPPDEFIEAVLSGPSPDSAEYQTLKKRHWDW